MRNEVARLEEQVGQVSVRASNFKIIEISWKTDQVLFLFTSDSVRCPDSVFCKLTLDYSCAFWTKYNAGLFCTTGDILMRMCRFKFKFLGTQAFGFTKQVRLKLTSGAEETRSI